MYATQALSADISRAFKSDFDVTKLSLNLQQRLISINNSFEARFVQSVSYPLIRRITNVDPLVHG